MCGIFSIINLNQKNTLNFSDLKKINNTLQHRGPDDEGYLIFDNELQKQIISKNFDLCSEKNLNNLNFKVALLHRRLSILDLSPLGHQPMSDINNRYHIVFNGEIYNFIELRKELEKLGKKFITKTDTEVLVKAYENWGIDSLKKFNGDWAFVLLDKIEKKLIISRDRFGIKPLYYFSNENLIIFSSEIKAILNHPDVKAKPNLKYFENYILNGANEWSAATSYENIFRFPIASYIVLDLQKTNNILSPIKYWQIKSNTKNTKFDKKLAHNYAKEYYKLLKDSVKIRLRSDVSIGCALSGGLDSSSIVYLVNEIYKELSLTNKVCTFSLVHKDKGSEYCDESKYINLMIKKFNLSAYKTYPNRKMLKQYIFETIRFWENPPDGLAMAGINTFELAARSGFKVTLDGQGADEQQAGYEIYLLNFLNELSIKQKLLQAFKFFIINKNKNLIIKILIWSLVPNYIKNFISRLFNLKIQSNMILLNKELENSINTSLVNLLHYADSRSMMKSIESRMPFMDHRLVEFNARIPAVYKIHNGWTKYYARLAFENKLPEEIVWRKDKIGWNIPEKIWIKNDLEKWANNLIKKSKLIKLLGIKFTTIKLTKLKIKLLNIAVLEKVFFEK